MIDTFEGGKIYIFAHYLLESNETPFRVVLDPQIGNLNQVLATQINSIVNRHYISLPDIHDLSQADFNRAYSERNNLAGQDLFELLASYLHVKTHFRVAWDFFD
jgi:hypothetical protein